MPPRWGAGRGAAPLALALALALQLCGVLGEWDEEILKKLATAAYEGNSAKISEILPGGVADLKALREYRVVFLVDDSRSMAEIIERREQGEDGNSKLVVFAKREELVKTVERVLPFAYWSTNQEVNLVFLNKDQKGKDKSNLVFYRIVCDKESTLTNEDGLVGLTLDWIQRVAQKCKVEASDASEAKPVNLLANVLKRRYAMKNRKISTAVASVGQMIKSKPGTKALVIMLTDGEAKGGDNTDEIVKSLKDLSDIEGIAVQVVLHLDASTETRRIVKNLRQLDGSCPEVDVMDDFESERHLIVDILETKDDWVWGDQIIKVLTGPILKEMDSLNNAAHSSFKFFGVTILVLLGVLVAAVAAVEGHLYCLRDGQDAPAEEVELAEKERPE